MNGKVRVKIDGKPEMEVPRAAYVKAKTKQLKAFGYQTVTEKEVDGQIDALLKGLEFGKGLTVIGMFMEDEIIKP